MRLTPNAALLGLVALTACAVPSREGYVARMSGFVGQSEGEVVSALGVPARTHDAEGRRFLQYEERRLVSYPGSAFIAGGRGGLGYGGFGYGLGYGFAPQVESRACDLTFELRGGRVQGFTARGDDCVAPAAVGSAAPPLRAG